MKYITYKYKFAFILNSMKGIKKDTFYLIELSIFGAAHSDQTIFWPTSQLIEKLETILTDIICIIFYMTYFIVQV